MVGPPRAISEPGKSTALQSSPTLAASSQCHTPPLPHSSQGSPDPVAVALRGHSRKEYLRVPGTTAANHNLLDGPYHEGTDVCYTAEVIILDVATERHKPLQGLLTTKHLYSKLESNSGKSETLAALLQLGDFELASKPPAHLQRHSDALLSSASFSMFPQSKATSQPTKPVKCIN